MVLRDFTANVMPDLYFNQNTNFLITSPPSIITFLLPLQCKQPIPKLTYK